MVLDLVDGLGDVYNCKKFSQAVYLRFVHFSLCFVSIKNLFICLSHRGFHGSRTVYVYAYKLSQVLFVQQTDQTGRDFSSNWCLEFNRDGDLAPCPLTTPRPHLTCNCHSVPRPSWPGSRGRGLWPFCSSSPPSLLVQWMQSALNKYCL